MEQTYTCLSPPSPCFGWEAVSQCIAHRPGMLSYPASGHIDAPPVSHTAAATWHSRRSQFSERYTKKAVALLSPVKPSKPHKETNTHHWILLIQ